MASFVTLLARSALGLLPIPAQVKERLTELEPQVRSRLEELGRSFVSIGEQLQAFAGPPLFLSAPGSGRPERPAEPARGEPPPEPFLVTFTVAHAGTRFGEQVYVAGDPEGLGRWEVKRALRLTLRSGGADGVWSAQVLLRGRTFQYKYLKWNPALPPATAQWERDQPTASRNREGTVEAPRAAPEEFRAS